jgi:glycosyltransferase involved in cell wall biosynthesis
VIDLCRIGPPHEVDALRARAHERFGDTVRVVEIDEVAGKSGTALVPWIRHPESLAPLATAAKLARRGRRTCWIDLDGTIGHCSARFFIRQGLRFALFALFDSITRVAAWLVQRMPPAGEAVVKGVGPAVIVLPVLPDLSHTFIYREAARILEHDPQMRIVVLERGLTSAPRHPEVAALLSRARFVPPAGIVRSYLHALGWFVRAPRRSSRLLRLYAATPEGAGSLFGKLPLREHRHPGKAFALASALSSLRVGSIHVYGSSYSANVSMGASILLGRPYSITSYVDFDFEYDHRMLDEKLATSTFFRVCTAYCRERLAELATGSSGREIPVILFGLDPDVWSLRETVPHGNVLFSACRLVPKKGLQDLAQAIAILRDEGFDVRWRLAGEGPERPYLEQLVADLDLGDRVELLGGVSTEQVRDELDAADLAVLACVVAPDGERDGIPIFLTEAMARGVPVLTTPVSGIPEIIEDGVTGFLAPPGEPVALARRIRAALDDRGHLARITASARAVVCERLDLDNSARALVDLIHGS